MRTRTNHRAAERLTKVACRRQGLAAPACVVAVLAPLLWSLSRAGQISDLPPAASALVARVCSPNLPVQERHSAYQALFDQPFAARQEALRQVVSKADEEIAAWATERLIQEREEGVVELIGARFPAWSYRNQRSAIAVLLSDGPKPSLLELPRIVLRKAAKDKTPAVEASDAERAVSLAALILTQSADPMDRALIGQATAAQPGLSGLWLARASAGPLGPGELKLAASVFGDERAPESVRVAAAVALAPTNSEASALVTRTLREFLMRYSSQDAELMLAHAWQETQPSGETVPMPEFGVLLSRLRLLGALQFLNTPAAESMTFEFLNAGNELIRKTLGLIAAIRWPQHLLRAGQGGLGTKEYASLLAVIALYHPELLDTLYLKVEAKAVDEARAELRRLGLHGPFFKAASAAFGF